MLNREELREIAAIQGNGAYFVSLYLNVNPVTNPKGDYAIWLKNARRSVVESRDKAVFKKVEKDLDAVDAYVLDNKREFRKGLVLLSSTENAFWRMYNLSVPLKNELVVDRTPYIKPLLDVMDNHPRHAILLVEKDSARIFVVHLGEITEYGEVHTPDVPGKHKKGGWFALSQDHYERHIEYHVGLHLKDVVRKFESFLKGEVINRSIIGGSEDAIRMTKGLLPRAVTDSLIGTFHAGMFESNMKVLKKAGPVLEAYERRREKETVEGLITRAMKNERAALGMEALLKALEGGRVMKLVMLRDFSCEGFQCSGCRALSAGKKEKCPYCGNRMEAVNYLVEFAAQRAMEQGALVEVVSESGELQRAGSIGAFLRF